MRTRFHLNGSLEIVAWSRSHLIHLDFKELENTAEVIVTIVFNFDFSFFGTRMEADLSGESGAKTRLNLAM